MYCTEEYSVHIVNSQYIWLKNSEAIVMILHSDSAPGEQFLKQVEKKYFAFWDSRLLDQFFARDSGIHRLAGAL